MDYSASKDHVNQALQTHIAGCPNKNEVERLRDDIGNLFSRTSKVEIAMAELRTELPHIKTQLGTLKVDVKEGFENMSTQLDQSRSRDDDAKTRGHRLAYGIMLTAITTLIGIAIKLAMSS